MAQYSRTATRATDIYAWTHLGLGAPATIGNIPFGTSWAGGGISRPELLGLPRRDLFEFSIWAGFTLPHPRSLLASRLQTRAQSTYMRVLILARDAQAVVGAPRRVRRASRVLAPYQVSLYLLDAYLGPGGWVRGVCSCCTHLLDFQRCSL